VVVVVRLTRSSPSRPSKGPMPVPKEATTQTLIFALLRKEALLKLTTLGLLSQVTKAVVPKTYSL
jgi:hypothetical protein